MHIYRDIHIFSAQLQLPTGVSTAKQPAPTQRLLKDSFALLSFAILSPFVKNVM